MLAAGVQAGAGRIGSCAVTAQHVVFQLGGDIAPRILKQADKIVGRVANESILKVDQALLAPQLPRHYFGDVARDLVSPGGVVNVDGVVDVDVVLELKPLRCPGHLSKNSSLFCFIFLK